MAAPSIFVSDEQVITVLMAYCQMTAFLIGKVLGFPFKLDGPISNFLTLEKDVGPHSRFRDHAEAIHRIRLLTGLDFPGTAGSILDWRDWFIQATGFLRGFPQSVAKVNFTRHTICTLLKGYVQIFYNLLVCAMKKIVHSEHGFYAQAQASTLRSMLGTTLSAEYQATQLLLEKIVCERRLRDDDPQADLDKLVEWLSLAYKALTLYVTDEPEC